MSTTLQRKQITSAQTANIKSAAEKGSPSSRIAQSYIHIHTNVSKSWKVWWIFAQVWCKVNSNHHDTDTDHISSHPCVILRHTNETVRHKAHFSVSSDLFYPRTLDSNAPIWHWAQRHISFLQLRLIFPLGKYTHTNKTADKEHIGLYLFLPPNYRLNTTPRAHLSALFFQSRIKIPIKNPDF